MQSLRTYYHLSYSKWTSRYFFLPHTLRTSVLFKVRTREEAAPKFIPYSWKSS